MEKDQRDLEEDGVMKMAYRYWGFDDNFRGPKEYTRSATHTAQTKKNAFKGAYMLIMSGECTSAKVYDERTKKKYDLFEDYGKRSLNINGRKVPKKTVTVYDRTDGTSHMLLSDGTLGEEILR